jgi:hypothetical protein
MEYMLVLQLPCSSKNDYDELLDLESALEEAIGDVGQVDGHDIGSGERNIFLFTENPSAAFEKIKPVFSSRGLMPILKGGYREVDGKEYTPVYPEGLRQFSVI